VARTYRCADVGERELGLTAAESACRRGQLVVLPTETVYGLATDAFSVEGVASMRRVQGRSRELPMPVLIGRTSTVDGLVLTLGPSGRALAEAFWPGPLMLVAQSHPSLRWDLGDSRGSVRMPIHPLALELLRVTGPLAVTAATRSGSSSPRTIAETEDLFGSDVIVYLDAGPLDPGPTSTVIDLTGPLPRVVREGAFPIELLREVAPDLLGPDEA
jgi:L-threonylcarbamoyladenylate synthase